MTSELLIRKLKKEDDLLIDYERWIMFAFDKSNKRKKNINGETQLKYRISTSFTSLWNKNICHIFFNSKGNMSKGGLLDWNLMAENQINQNLNGGNQNITYN